MSQKIFRMHTRYLVSLLIASLSGCFPIRDTSMAITALHHLSDADDARLKVIVQTQTLTISGSGVWLGNGQVLTAAHLFVGLKDGYPVGVVIHRRTLTGTLLSHGDLGDYDLALVTIPLSEIPKDVAAIPVPIVCRSDESIGARLYVVAHDQTRSTLASPEDAVEAHGRSWSTATTATFSHGVSGAGVFDARIGCLAGIVSRSESALQITFNPTEHRKCIHAIVEGGSGPPDITCEFDSPTLFTPATRVNAYLHQSADHVAHTSNRQPK